MKTSLKMRFLISDFELCLETKIKILQGSSLVMQLGNDKDA